MHLTVNAEYELYRWGPITYAPSLLGGDGGFPRTMEDVWDHADLDEVRRECRAQIERAILWGFDVSHLDAHMGTLQLRPEFFDVYLELALEFGLPLRMVSASMERYLGFPARAVAAGEGAVFTDHFRMVPGVGSRRMFERDIATLRPGVTELHLHPAVDSAELRSLATDDWEARVDDHRIICDEDWVRGALDRGRRHPDRLPAVARPGPRRRLMNASTSATIHGVSILSKQGKPPADVFDLALSPEGIAIQRPGRSDQHMSWERIAQWEIEERPDCVVLTLRGGGSVTPLMVQGWTVEDLETVMRETTGGGAGPATIVADEAPAPARRSPSRRPTTTAQLLEATRDGGAARPRGRRGRPGAVAERRRHQLELPGPRRLIAGAHSGEEVVLGHVGRAHAALGQAELVDGMDVLHHLRRQAEPELRGGVDLCGMRLQRLGCARGCSPSRRWWS